MTKHTYKAGAVQEGRLDRTIFEIETGDGDQETGKREFLGLPVRLRGEYIFAIVKALQKAYQRGREDREAEPHQLPGDGSWQIEALRNLLLGAMESEGRGLTRPSGPDKKQLFVERTGSDLLNGELRFNLSPEWRQPGVRARVRLVIEEY